MTSKYPSMLTKSREPPKRPSETAIMPRIPALRFRERSEEHTSELQSHLNLVCRLLLEKKKHRHALTYLNPRAYRAGHAGYSRPTDEQLFPLGVTKALMRNTTCAETTYSISLVIHNVR